MNKLNIVKAKNIPEYIRAVCANTIAQMDHAKYAFIWNIIY